MIVKKYKGKILDTDEYVVGYIIEQRQYVEDGCYTGGKQYLIYVTEYSMPNSIIRGGFIVDETSIIELNPIKTR